MQTKDEVPERIPKILTNDARLIDRTQRRELIVLSNCFQLLSLLHLAHAVAQGDCILVGRNMRLTCQFYHYLVVLFPWLSCFTAL